jgi:hypothetical protein
MLLALLACGCAGRIERMHARECTPLVVDAERAPSCPTPPRSGQYMIVVPASEADELDIEDASRVFNGPAWVAYADPWTCDADGRIAAQVGEVAAPVLDDPSDLDVNLSRDAIRFRIRVDGRDYVMQYDPPMMVSMPGEGHGCLTVFPGEGGRALHRVSASFGWRHWLEASTEGSRAPRLIFAVVDDATVLMVTRRSVALSSSSSARATRGSTTRPNWC